MDPAHKELHRKRNNAEMSNYPRIPMIGTIIIRYHFDILTLEE